MRILVIAPDHADLPNVAAEIAAISRHHDATILSGMVRDSDIALAVEENDYDVLWWLTHGDKDGVVLSDGHLSAAGVGQYVRSSNARLNILNTCDSEQVALRIVAAGQADMVCTIGAVDNQDAIRIGMLLAPALSELSDTYAAYKAVAPTGGQYRYLKAGTQYRRRPDDHQPTIADVLNVLAGDRFGQPGLVRRVEAIESRLGSVEGRLSGMEAEIVDLRSVIQERFQRGRVTLTPMLALAVIVVMLVMAIALAVLVSINARGGVVDGRVGAAVFALFFL